MLYSIGLKLGFVVILALMATPLSEDAGSWHFVVGLYILFHLLERLKPSAFRIDGLPSPASNRLKSSNPLTIQSVIGVFCLLRRCPLVYSTLPSVARVAFR